MTIDVGLSIDRAPDAQGTVWPALDRDPIERGTVLLPFTEESGRRRLIRLAIDRRRLGSGDPIDRETRGSAAAGSRRRLGADGAGCLWIRAPPYPRPPAEATPPDRARAALRLAFARRSSHSPRKSP